MLKKNDLIPLEIDGMTSEGSGVGRYQDIVVFVANSAVGDRLTVRIIKTAKKYCIGKIETIDTPSPNRIEPDCPVFRQCGGCVYRHISYEHELEIKEQKVRDALTRIAGFPDLMIRPIVGAENPDHYRNKAQLPIGRDREGKPVMGFYASRSHRIIPCDSCALQPEVFRDAIRAVSEWMEHSGDDVYDEKTGKGRLRHLYIREGSMTGERMVCLVVNGNGVHQEDLLVRLLRENVPGLKSIIINSNRENTNVILGARYRTVWGSETITDRLCGLVFQISPASFYQVNRNQAEKLYRIAGEFAQLTGKEVLLDLYCGTGTIGLTMAEKAKQLIGVEVIPQAVENAEANAERNQIRNAEFLCGDASLAADSLYERGIRPDVVVLDPPRKGCSDELVETVSRMGPERVVYVSCDPATLARDLQRFKKFRYMPKEAVPVDLFPRTAHVETVVLMSRVKD